MDSPNIQWPSGDAYLVGDKGTGAWGVKDVQPFIPDEIVATENFESDPISGSGTWTTTNSSPHTGVRCLRSAVIGNNQTTDYVFNVPLGSTQIRFWHRVSSEQNFDFFRVLVDAVQVFQLSGTANVWAQATFSVIGATTVTFRYVKDGSSAVGLDAAFIDDIEWIGAPGQAAIQLYEPFHLDTNNCVKVVLCNNDVEVIGTVDTRPLDCITDSVTICPPVSGSFDVEVINEVIIRPLDCLVDSVTICPPASGVFDVEVIGEVNTRPLDCATDSVTMCPPVSGVFNVEVTDLPTDQDVFGAGISTTRYNQVEIDFSNGLPGVDYITTTTSGGGTVTATAGSGIISSGVGANGKALITSDPLTDYRPGFEMYFWGTATFTIPTSASSFQRIGLYDDNNGYFIGYEGTTFGFTRRSGGADNFTAIAAWDDPLTGGPTSKFTRDGVPEVFDPTKFNVYRVRFGWFGSAICVLELLAPDGHWVEALRRENPNFFTVPHIQNPNLPVRIQVDKTGSDGTDLIIKSGCVAAGATSDIEEVEKPIRGTSLAKLVKAVLTGKTPSGSYVNVAVNNTGRVFVTNDAIYAEDSPHTSGEVGTFVLGVRNDNNIVTTSADRDYTALSTDSTGALKVVPGLGTFTFIPGKRTLRGLYYGSSGAIAYTTAADAATGGDLWIVNTSASVIAYVREIRFTSNIAALALLTALPRINVERMTFTGTPSGAQITPAKRDSTDQANTATVRTANTGMTITTGAVIKSFSPPSSDVIGGLLAANASSSVPVEQIFLGDIDSFIVLRQNEGIVLRQATAGSGTENRTYNVDFMWEEI